MIFVAYIFLKTQDLQKKENVKLKSVFTSGESKTARKPHFQLERYEEKNMYKAFVLRTKKNAITNQQNM